MPDRPYLLLDVGGPLNPHRAKTIPPGYALHDIREGSTRPTCPTGLCTE
jgi:hypothetical protein